MTKNYGTLSGMSTIGGSSIKRKATPSQKRNLDGGGFGWKTDKWTQFRRFLILGSDKPTYYATERHLTQVNLAPMIACLEEDHVRYVDTLVEMRSGGIAPNSDTSLFALAVLSTKGSPEAKAYARSVIGKICRSGYDIQSFTSLVTGTTEHGAKRNYMRGWGRSFRTTVSSWVTDRPLKSLVYQAIKYRSRAGTSMAKIVRLSHPNPGNDEALSAVLYWIAKGEMKPGFDYQSNDDTAQIWAFEAAKQTVGNKWAKNSLLELIISYRLPWEAVPTEWLTDSDVLAALAADMPINATVRNLSRFSWTGTLDVHGTKATIVDRLSNPNVIKRENIHPMKLLQAFVTYRDGQGTKSKWPVDQDIVRALEKAFYMSFDNVEPTGLNRMIAIDVSGSMLGPLWTGTSRFTKDTIFKNCSGLSGVNPKEAAAALAMITMRTEPWYYITAFSNQTVKLDLSPDMTLDQVLRELGRIRAGYTNVADPIVKATNLSLPVDLFEIYTDNEANYGQHPSVALSRYQATVGRKAKMAFVAMVGYDDSLADPNRNDMMDFVGFDPTTPVMLARFATGDL